MYWGNNETFEKVQSAIETGNGKLYSELMGIIKIDVISRVKKKIPRDSVDDVMQEIYLSVFKYMVNYIDIYRDCSACERNAWLMKITNSKINNFWRAYYKYYEWAYGKKLGSGRVLFSLTEIETRKTGDGETFSEYDLAQFDEQLENVTDIVADDLPLAEIEKICSIHSSPDKILAFLFYKYLFEKNKNAKSKQIIEKLSGYTLGELYCIFLNSLSYNQTVREKLEQSLSELYEVLNQRLDNDYYYNMLFCLTAKQSTDTIYLINKKMFIDKSEYKRNE